MLLAARRHSRLLAAAAALGFALVASACGGTGATTPAAVTVNGEAVDGKEFAAHLRLYVDNDEFVAAQAQQGQPVEGSLEGAASAQLASRLLADEIFFKLVQAELAARGIEVAPGNTELSRTLFAPRFLGGQAAFDAFPQAFRDQYVAKVAQYISLQSDFAGITDLQAAADKALAEDADTFASRCVSHILVDTEADAKAIQAELRAGADFAELAAQRSTDTGSGAQGGALGCLSAADTTATYVPEFAEAANAAEVGEVTDPVESQFGFHLILVTGTEPGGVESVLQALLQPAGPDYTAWLRTAFGEADIQVNPRYGTWDPVTNSVRPPEGSAVPGNAFPTTTAAG